MVELMAIPSLVYANYKGVEENGSIPRVAGHRLMKKLKELKLKLNTWNKNDFGNIASNLTTQLGYPQRLKDAAFKTPPERSKGGDLS